MGTLKVQEQREGQVMIEIAITLGPNCKKSAHNWALVQQRGIRGVKVQFFLDISMQSLQAKPRFETTE